MQTLAIKYRPTTFNDVVEQGPIKQILLEQLKTKTHKNCYLFTGGAGTGKTTCARIFANEINQFKGNAIEIDGASNNGVENVRTIIEGAKFKALDAEFKIYIIDECHMLSTGAWNAMLKLIEEPPAKTIFIFCTTDPQKIPNTILSRVQRYDFTRITHDGIVKRLDYILREEAKEIAEKSSDVINYKKEALSYIAKIADGGMRDAITMLDKCISFSSTITEENIVKALGTTNYNTMLNLTIYLYDLDVKNVIATIEDLHRSGIDLKQFIKQYSYFILDLCKYSILGNFDYLQIPITYEPILASKTDEFYQFVNDMLSPVLKLATDIKWETTPKPLIEMCLILICQEGINDRTD
jgi:DNA polymerase-3 subunit gamma/tau